MRKGLVARGGPKRCGDLRRSCPGNNAQYEECHSPKVEVKAAYSRLFQLLLDLFIRRLTGSGFGVQVASQFIRPTLHLIPETSNLVEEFGVAVL